jgi:hypothetical protein
MNKLATAALAVLVASGLGGILAAPAIADDAPDPGITETVVETPAYHLVAWLVPGGPADPFGPDQTVFAEVLEDTADLSALDNSEFACGSYYQIDLYLNDSTTDALIAGNVLHGPNDPTEHLAFGAVDGNPWKYITTDVCETPPVDVCDNIDGVQTEVPDGYTLDGDYCCPPVDVCDNIEGNQSEVPDGLAVNDDSYCYLPVTECESESTLPTATDVDPMGWGDLLNGTWEPGGIQLTATAVEEAYAYLDFDTTIPLSEMGSLVTEFTDQTGSFGVIIHNTTWNIHFDGGTYWTTTPGLFPGSGSYYSVTDLRDAMADPQIDEIAVWVNPGGSLFLTAQHYNCTIQPFSAVVTPTPTPTPSAPALASTGVDADQTGTLFLGGAILVLLGLAATIVTVRLRRQ